MTTKDDLPESIKSNYIDSLTAALKGALGAVPVAGSLIAEIVGAIIPKQRIDRISEFVSILEKRIGLLESKTIKDAIEDMGFIDLTEESLWQAIRATTSNRLEYLANLLVSSLSNESISFIETKHLMQILGELNDIEIVWLRYYSNIEFNSDHEFRELHKNLLEPITPFLDSPPEIIDASALQGSYKDHLLRLGLIFPQIVYKRDGTPEFDKLTGNFKVAFYQASLLGRLLLRHIGLTPSVKL